MMILVLDMMRRAALARHDLLVKLTVPKDERPGAYIAHHKLVNDLYLPLIARWTPK